MDDGAIGAFERAAPSFISISSRETFMAANALPLCPFSVKSPFFIGPHRSRYAASVRPPGSQPTKLRRPEPPKLQKGVGGVAVDLPPVQNLGDDLADAVGGQPLLPRDLVIGPALVEPREDALASRRPAEGGEPFLRRRAIPVPCRSPFPPTDAALAKERT